MFHNLSVVNVKFDSLGVIKHVFCGFSYFSLVQVCLGLRVLLGGEAACALLSTDGRPQSACHVGQGARGRCVARVSHLLTDVLRPLSLF